MCPGGGRDKLGLHGARMLRKIVNARAGVKNKRPASLKPAGRPVDCLGLTKRWVLYVASSATPGSPDRPASGGFNPYSPVVCGL